MAYLELKKETSREARKEIRRHLTDRLSREISEESESQPLLVEDGGMAPIPVQLERQGFKSDIVNLGRILKEQWYINILLLILPVAVASEHLHWPKWIIFLLNFLVIIPLANLLGIATEELALRSTPSIGGLLNATFGNAVELIVSIAALKKGLIKVVQGSLLGSILSNLLLVLGFCFLFGGLKYKEQHFNAGGAGTMSSLLQISVIGMCVPYLFHGLNISVSHREELLLSRCVAIVLSAVYCFYVYFQLVSHQYMFESSGDYMVQHNNNEQGQQGNSGEEDEVVIDEDEEEVPLLTLTCSIVMLLVVTLIVAYCSELLTGSIEGMSEYISPTFIGIILLPIVGNAAEHMTAVSVAMKNKMDLSIGVAVGSSAQIALFVVPVITIAGWIMDQPMDLNFQSFDTGLLVLTVLIVHMVIQDGNSNYFEGILLISVYFIIALACYFNPDKIG